jgi:very-short-patch-repair endonuclease
MTESVDYLLQKYFGKHLEDKKVDYASNLSIVSEENGNGIVAFVINRSFIDSRMFDGFRKIVQQEFKVAYIIDIKGGVCANLKTAGMAIVFLVKGQLASPPAPLHIGEGRLTVETQLPSHLLAYARELRQRLTDAEELLWQLLRNRKVNNLKFRRQHPLKVGFILDFYCAEKKLGIEIDGGYHNTLHQKEYDIERTKVIQEYGIKIIRFTNDEVLYDTENVLKKIVLTPLLPSPIWRGAGGEANCAIHYTALDDFLHKEQKLQWLTKNPLKDISFKIIHPDKNNNWINPTENDIDNLLS